MTHNIAERSFDLRTSGLWAQHASTAPLCSQVDENEIRTMTLCFCFTFRSFYFLICSRGIFVIFSKFSSAVQFFDV
jgi:hypothetical protein